MVVAHHGDGRAPKTYDKQATIALLQQENDALRKRIAALEISSRALDAFASNITKIFNFKNTPPIRLAPSNYLKPPPPVPVQKIPISVRPSTSNAPSLLISSDRYKHNETRQVIKKNVYCYAPPIVSTDTFPPQSSSFLVFLKRHPHISPQQNAITTVPLTQSSPWWIPAHSLHNKQQTELKFIRTLISARWPLIEITSLPTAQTRQFHTTTKSASVHYRTDQPHGLIIPRYLLQHQPITSTIDITSIISAETLPQRKLFSLHPQHAWFFQSIPYQVFISAWNLPYHFTRLQTETLLTRKLFLAHLSLQHLLCLVWILTLIHTFPQRWLYKQIY